MMQQEKAQILALQALAWLAADEDRIGPFLAQSGIGLADLQARAGESDVLAAVLDFILGDDSRVLAWADEADLRPEAAAIALSGARGALPGGAVPDWT